MLSLQKKGSKKLNEKNYLEKYYYLFLSQWFANTKVTTETTIFPNIQEATTSISFYKEITMAIARVIKMITQDKIKIYTKYNGDITSWARTGSKREKLVINDDDWYLIDGFIQNR